MITVGIVSPGAMGAAIGHVLAAGGARVVATVAGRSERTVGLARGLELRATLDDLVSEAAILLSVVPPGAALDVAREVGAVAGRIGAQPLYVDLNAIAPSTVVLAVEILSSSGVHLVDGSISGPPPRLAGSTVIYLSGPRAAQVASLDAPGLELRVVGDEIGTASAIKMSTASFYKGQTAILAQALRAAHANGVLQFVLDDLGRHYPDLVDDAPRMLQSIAAKAGRYVAEMEEISASQAAAGLPPELFAALSKVFVELSRSPAATRAPEDADANARLEDVLASLDQMTESGSQHSRPDT